eukprot:gene12407-6074_t
MTDIYFTIKDVKGSKDAPFQLLVNDEECFISNSDVKEEKYKEFYLKSQNDFVLSVKIPVLKKSGKLKFGLEKGKFFSVSMVNDQLSVVQRKDRNFGKTVTKKVEAKGFKIDPRSGAKIYTDGVGQTHKKDYEPVEFKKVEFTKYEKPSPKQENDMKTTTKTTETIDDLEKYADLLKKGILTQQEFDAKKKQILGL